MASFMLHRVRRLLLASLFFIGCSSRPPAGASAQSLPSANSANERVPEAVRPPALFDRLVERVEDGLSPLKRARLPASLRDLDYDGFRAIRYRPELSLWRDEPGRFEVQFFHAGWFRDLVDVYVAEADRVRPFPFSTRLFSYGEMQRPSSATDLGFTGLRVHAPINRADYRDEVIVFQGASYFRSLGRGQVYGLSARSLAVDMGGEEEFPAFKAFYLVRPAPRDRTLWVLATLGSRRVRAVYAYRVRPGQTTTIDVVARVWLQGDIDALGLAPMSSMFLFGEEAPASFDDFRPEVHDSDGMAFLSARGERLFRPLRNPPRTALSVFRLDSPRGFGLLQRDREFASYQDLEARYQDRPAAWVEPLSDWGPGTLHLLEIATQLETDDNIGLAWVPDHVPAEGLSLRYRIHFGPDAAVARPRLFVVATRHAAGPRGRRFIVDFQGDELGDVDELSARVDVDGGRVLEQHLVENSHARAARLSFEVEPEAGARDVELRAFVRRGRDVLSETWSYRWQPNP